MGAAWIFMGSVFSGFRAIFSQSLLCTVAAVQAAQFVYDTKEYDKIWVWSS